MGKSNVRKINGVEITGTPSSGQVPVAISDTEAEWTDPGSGALSGVVVKDPSEAPIGGNLAKNVIQRGGYATVYEIALPGRALIILNEVGEPEDAVTMTWALSPDGDPTNTPIGVADMKGDGEFGAISVVASRSLEGRSLVLGREERDDDVTLDTRAYNEWNPFLTGANGASSATVIAVTGTSGPTTVTLPSPGREGWVFIIKDEDGVAGSDSITIEASSGDSIDGQASLEITEDYGSVMLYADGNATWHVVGSGAGIIGSGGEANTASNVGASGVGIFKQKTGVDLEFKKLLANSSKVSITSDASNVKIDVSESNLTIGNLGGTLGISKGGTGQTTKTAAMDALSPTTTKGDLLVDDGTNLVRLPVGSDGQVLTADAAQSAGVKWAASSASMADNRHLRQHAWMPLFASSTTLAYNFYAGSSYTFATGSASNLNDSTGTYVSYATGGTINTNAGYTTGSVATFVQPQALPTFIARIKTGADISNVRIWAGMSNDSNPMGSSTAPNSSAMFRYATDVDGTAFWRTVTKNTSSTVNTSSVAVTTDTMYVLKIVFVSTSSVEFYINGALVATHTTNLPGASDDQYLHAMVQNLAAVTKSIRIGRIYLESA